MKILIIQQRYGIGDMVIFLPYIHAISKKFNTPVSLLAKESSRAREIFYGDERINKVITLNKDNDGLRGFLKTGFPPNKDNLSFFRKFLNTTTCIYIGL